VDSGVEEGTEIGVYYDPLLAKIIAHAPDRQGAINKLVYALRHHAAQGVESNREFLINLLDSEEFRSGQIHTGSDITVYAREEAPEKRAAEDAVFTAALRAWSERTEHAQRQVLPSIPLRFRNNPYPARPMILKIAGPELNARATDVAIDVLDVDGEGITVVADGVQHHFRIRRHGDEYYVRSDLGQRTIKRMPRYPRSTAAAKHQTANSPMPGQVLRVLVSVSQRVKAGDVLVVLEAMKMEQNINATMDGLVAAILVKPGQIVAPGQMLVEIQSVEASNEHANRSAAND
jgi:propionyl-CoA carboxylase alpha chain